MPIDSSIALGVRPVQFDNPMELAGKAMSLRALAGQQQLQQMQIQQAQQQQDQERTLADIYKGNINPDGTVNRQSLLGAAAQQGLGNRIPALQKQFADADKATADVGHVGAQTSEIQLNMQKKKLDLAGGAINSLLSNPNVTHDDVITTVTGLVQQGIIDQNQGMQMVRSLPGNPQALRQFLVQKGLETMDASKRMEMMTPKFEKIDNGGAIQMGTVDPLTGQFSAGNAIKKVATPDAVLSSSTTMRGQNMTDNRERALAANGVTYQQDQNGNMVALPTKAAPGMSIRGAPVLGADGKPFQGSKGDLSDTQAKALLFGSRMQESNRLLDSLAAQGVTQPGIIKRVAGATPLVGGGLETLTNFTQSAPQQQVEQAQRDFVNAVLRRESGAAISPSEFDSAKKQYFPSVGDTPEVISQKQRNRALAINGMMAEVPQSRRTLPNVAGNGAVPQQSGQIDFQLPPDIQSILNKHGAK